MFVIWELTDAHPGVDLALFRGRNFSVSTLAMALGYGVFFGNIVLLPLWLWRRSSYPSLRSAYPGSPPRGFRPPPDS